MYSSLTYEKLFTCLKFQHSNWTTFFIDVRFNRVRNEVGYIWFLFYLKELILLNFLIENLFNFFFLIYLHCARGCEVMISLYDLFVLFVRELLSFDEINFRIYAFHENWTVKLNFKYLIFAFNYFGLSF